VEVEEHEVEAVLRRLQEAMAQVRPVQDRDVVQSGDVAVLDYQGFVDGRPLAGLRAESRAVEVGRGEVLPQLEERLIGLTKGSTTEIAVRYPEEGVRADLAGRWVTFRVTVKEIGVKELAALDDEFAKDHGECETLAQLRERVRADLLAAARRREEERVRDELLGRLVERNPVEVPASLVERRFERMLVELGVAAEGRRPELPEELRRELMERARRQVHGMLVLEALARQEGLSVEESEVGERIASIAGAAGERAAQVQAWYRQEENREGLRAHLLREKALALVVDRAKIKTLLR
jgi:trigger factor